MVATNIYKSDLNMLFAANYLLKQQSKKNKLNQQNMKCFIMENETKYQADFKREFFNIYIIPAPITMLDY